MRLLLVAALFLSLSSCKKEEVNIDIKEFMQKYLICDSIKVSTNDLPTLMVKGRGAGSDIKIGGDYTIYSSPEQKLRYRIINSRIYYWPKTGDIHDDGDYLKINSKNGKHLVLEHKDIVTKEIRLYYYTSQ